MIHDTHILVKVDSNLPFATPWMKFLGSLNLKFSVLQRGSNNKKIIFRLLFERKAFVSFTYWCGSMLITLSQTVAKHFDTAARVQQILPLFVFCAAVHGSGERGRSGSHHVWTGSRRHGRLPLCDRDPLPTALRALPCQCHTRSCHR